MNTDKNSLLDVLSKNIGLYRDIFSLVYTKKNRLLYEGSLLGRGIDDSFLDDRAGFIGGFGLFVGKYRFLEVLG